MRPLWSALKPYTPKQQKCTQQIVSLHLCIHTYVCMCNYKNKRKRSHYSEGRGHGKVGIRIPRRHWRGERKGKWCNSILTIFKKKKKSFIVLILWWFDWSVSHEFQVFEYLVLSLERVRKCSLPGESMSLGANIEVSKIRGLLPVYSFCFLL